MTIVSVILTGRAPSVTYRVNRPDGSEFSRITATLADRAQWIRARWRLSNALLASEGMERVERHNASALGLVVWALETGYGDSERRGNVGSIHCPAASVDSPSMCCMRIGREVLRGYYCGADSASALAEGPPAGVRAFWSVVRTTYPLAFDLFKRAALNAPEELFNGGWAETTPSAAQFESIWRTVQLALGPLEGVDGFEVPDARRIDEPAEGGGGDGGDGGSEEENYGDGDGGDGGGGVNWLLAAVLGVVAVASQGEER